MIKLWAIRLALAERTCCMVFDYRTSEAGLSMRLDRRDTISGWVTWDHLTFLLYFRQKKAPLTGVVKGVP
jgi:hypothetical protein